MSFQPIQAKYRKNTLEDAAVVVIANSDWRCDSAISTTEIDTIATQSAQSGQTEAGDGIACDFEIQAKC